jgi:hypothetical protein
MLFKKSFYDGFRHRTVEQTKRDKETIYHLHQASHMKTIALSLSSSVNYYSKTSRKCSNLKFEPVSQCIVYNGSHPCDI